MTHYNSEVIVNDTFLKITFLTCCWYVEVQLIFIYWFYIQQLCCTRVLILFRALSLKDGSFSFVILVFHTLPAVECGPEVLVVDLSAHRQRTCCRPWSFGSDLGLCCVLAASATLLRVLVAVLSDCSKHRTLLVVTPLGQGAGAACLLPLASVYTAAPRPTGLRL